MKIKFRVSAPSSSLNVAPIALSRLGRLGATNVQVRRISEFGREVTFEMAQAPTTAQLQRIFGKIHDFTVA